MIRNVFSFLAALVAILAVVFVIDQSNRGEKWLTNILGLGHLRWQGMSPLVGGSNIRVVGGSLQITLFNGVSFATGNEVSVENTDTRTFMIENVSETQNGKPENQPYSVTRGTWTIKEVVRDPSGKRGITITGTVGSTRKNGTVSFKTMTDHESFTKISSTERDYSNDDKGKAGHCPGTYDAQKECERADTITVTAGGYPDTWYCVQKDGTCHVDIGQWSK